MEVNELFKHRSITSCMRASYDTITSDFRSFVKQTWTTHVPFAVLLAIVLYFLLPNKPLHDWGAVNPMASFILQTIIYGATIVMAIVGIATFIAALPSIILIIAQFYSQLGALDGDPLGVPDYFTPLLFLVFTITFLLIIYALSWLGISLAYQFGSYKVQDEAKKRMKESQKMATAEIEKY